MVRHALEFQGPRVMTSQRASRVSKSPSATIPKIALVRARKRAARDPEGTRKAILDAAVREFAREGYGGGLIDRISTAARRHDRMVYYYFGSKEALFREAIEAVYASLVEAEKALDLDLDDPVRAITSIVEFNWRYYIAHPELISILNSENLHRARHIRQSREIHKFASPQLAIIDSILSRGVAKGIFRSGVTAEFMFLTIAGLTYFYLSNIHTLSNYLSRDLAGNTALDGWLSHIKRVVIDTLTATTA
jgi:TetR/AcrR family transcriptional regulator, upper aerobic nicotinate degradation pathway regulator